MSADNNDNEKWYNSDFASNISIGIIIFLICLGIGTCSHLVQ